MSNCEKELYMINFLTQSQRGNCLSLKNGVALLTAQVYEHCLHKSEQWSHKLGKGREKYLNQQEGVNSHVSDLEIYDILEKYALNPEI